MTLTIGSLFSGIGGLELGLERAGMEVRWQVEYDTYCNKILEKHWPNVKRYGDIYEVKGKELEKVNVICGGFPCQPFSCAGKRKGTKDSRWLWPEFYRIVCEVRPEWVIIENVPGLLSIDTGRVFTGILKDLAEAGYDAEWCIISAADLGAIHLRKRVFVIANSIGMGREKRTSEEVQQEIKITKGQEPEHGSKMLSEREDMADTDRTRNRTPGSGTNGNGKKKDEGREEQPLTKLSGYRSIFNGDIVQRLRERNTTREGVWERDPANVPNAESERGECREPRNEGEQTQSKEILLRRCNTGEGKSGTTQPYMGRVANGVPNRVHRLKCLGNAVVPQVAEAIGVMIIIENKIRRWEERKGDPPS